MKFIRYIYEGPIIQNVDIAKLATSINSDCKAACAEIRAARKLLYRGIKYDEELWSKEKTRMNRMPKDTSRALHEVLDKSFQKKFGWRARSQGLICSNSGLSANDYGHIRVIFPIGKYKALWRPGTEDIMDVFPWWFDDAANGFLRAVDLYNRQSFHVEKFGKIDTNQDTEKQMEQLQNIMHKLIDMKLNKFKYTSLKEPLSQDWPIEIMLNCKSYYSVSTQRRDFIQALTKHLDIQVSN